MRHPNRPRPALVCLTVLCLLVAAAALRPRAGGAQVTSYTVTDLGTLGGPESKAFGVNNSGRVVGHSQPAPGSSLPFAWMGGAMTNMNSFGGTDGGAAYAVNESGYAVGNAAVSNNNAHVFVWSDIFGKKDLGTLGGVFATAFDINDANQIVGQSEIGQLIDRGFVWDSANGMRQITTLGGNSSAARGINNLGQIVGYSATRTGQTHAFLLSDGTMTDLGTLGTGSLSFAYEINDAGQVVGYSTTSTGGISPVFHAFLYTKEGGMQDLGALPGTSGRSVAYDINAGGEVVGYSEIARGVSRAFVWDSVNGMRDLNDLTAGSNWTLLEARSINNRGQIVGFGTNPSGFLHAFLLTPVRDGPPADEPAPCITAQSAITLPAPAPVQLPNKNRKALPLSPRPFTRGTAGQGVSKRTGKGGTETQDFISEPEP
ncbi:MAG TPA: DUF3466 family protein [Pyrinomonadaceae bacterium]|nr:DUF3466 family protein [Pyrinomonadaceae bacterium]